MVDDGGQPNGKRRELGGALNVIVSALFAALTLIGVLWAMQVQHMVGLVLFREQFLALILGLGLSATFLAIKAHKNEPAGRGVPWHDWIGVAASIAVTGNIVLFYPEMTQDIASTEPERWALGWVAVMLAFEATRRLVGWSLVVLALAFILYARFSHLFSGILEAPSTDWTRLGAYFYLDTNAILGLPLTVMSTIVIAFILFGRVLYAMNADKVLTEASLVLMGRYRGGPAKVAVGASSLFGTISGSVVSNVVMDGPITIPMMVRAGYRPHMAAAIEAVASTGGQIMPPVMGITAFLIADWLGIGYGEVVVAALFPAVLYYIALFVQIDLEAAKGGMVGLPADQLPRLRPVLRRCWIFVVPIALLIYTLIWLAWEPGRAASVAVAAALAVGLLDRDTRPGLRRVWIAVTETGETVLDLIAITAIAGLIIGALQVSGLAFGMSLIFVTLAGGSLLLLLLMSGALSIVLGMGMPTAVIYILLAILVAPALTDFGVPALGAHLFLFYFGMLSMITPPMCIATFAAASIARCNFWSAGWFGVRLGIVAYVIPFIFIFHPELLLIGEPLEIALAAASAIIGVVFIAAGCAGFLFTAMHPAVRILLVVAGLSLIPSPANDRIWMAVNFAGLATGLALALWQRRAAAASKRELAG